MASKEIRALRAKHGLTQQAFGDANPPAQVIELLLIKLEEVAQ